MFKQPTVFVALLATSAVAFWGLWSTESLAAAATALTTLFFEARGWFIMVTVTVLIVTCIFLAASPYGRLRLGHEGDEPEFSTGSWLAMLFAAGMGVGLLYWGSAEPVTHFEAARPALPESGVSDSVAAGFALFITNFHWGIHAWTIYATLALIIAYFSFRQDQPMLVSAPLRVVFGHQAWTRLVAPVSDFCALVAVALGVSGSVAMGIFQVKSGVEYLFGWGDAGLPLALGLTALLIVAYMLPLTVDLDRGMSLISNACVLATIGLMLYVLLTGPTHYILNAIVETAGDYATGVLAHGLKLFTFATPASRAWFKNWTLTYMVWWLAWSPFVSVFIARISRGRTIREFLVMVILLPTLFSVMWFGVFGGLAFSEVLAGNTDLVDVVANDLDRATFFVLELLPFSELTSLLTTIVAFFFVITSVVSAAYVMAIFSLQGDVNPGVRVKLLWGGIIGALGIVMVLAGDIDTVRKIIAVGALPFVSIVLLLLVALLKDLKRQPLPPRSMRAVATGARAPMEGEEFAEGGR